MNGYNVFDSGADAVFMSFMRMSDATVKESNLISLNTFSGVVGEIKKLFVSGVACNPFQFHCLA